MKNILFPLNLYLYRTEHNNRILLVTRTKQQQKTYEESKREKKKLELEYISTTTEKE